MKAVKISLAIIAVLAVAAVAVAWFLPSAWRVERVTVIRAPAAAIFSDIASLKRWPDWTVWYEPDIKVAYEGPEAGVGAVSRWVGKDGEGEMTVVASEQDRRMRYRLVFDRGEFMTEGEFTLTSDRDGTRVVWAAWGDVGDSFFGRYFALLLKPMLGSDFETSLAKLKKRHEKSGG